MPLNDPLIGEVWETLTHDVLQQASVADVTPTQIFLLGRQGRIVVFPRKSFLLTWGITDREHTPIRCMDINCPNGWACARTLDNRWFCRRHLPRNLPLLLPGDNASADRTLIGDFDQCPLCNAQRQAGKVSWQLVHDYLLYSCTCNARWIMLILEGVSQVNAGMGQDIIAAYSILETELCLDIKVKVGLTVMGVLRNTLTELRGQKEPKLAGIPLLEDPSVGATNVLIVGRPPKSNVMDGSIPLMSRWAHKERHLVLRVFATEDDVREDREVLLVDVSDPHHVVALPEDQLKEEFLPVASSTPGTSRHSEEIPGMMFEEWSTLRIPNKAPLPGEVWWHDYSAAAVQVFGLGADPQGTNFIRMQKGRMSYKMVLNDFQVYHSFGSKEDQGLVRGEEYARPGEDVTFFLESLGLRDVTLKSTADGTYRTVSISEFRALYERIFRSSALDQLLDDDEPV